MHTGKSDDEVSQLTDVLRGRSLNARVRNRDQVLFECGQAAAAQKSRRCITAQRMVGQSFLVTCSLCVGAFVMHLIRPPEPRFVEPPVIVNQKSVPNEEIRTSSLFSTFYSAKEMSAVAAEQLLCASSNLETLQTQSYSSMEPFVDDESPIRAGGMGGKGDFEW